MLVSWLVGWGWWLAGLLYPSVLLLVYFARALCTSPWSFLILPPPLFVPYPTHRSPLQSERSKEVDQDKYHFALSGKYETFQIRVFCKVPSKERTARKAFEEWCRNHKAHDPFPSSPYINSSMSGRGGAGAGAGGYYSGGGADEGAGGAAGGAAGGYAQGGMLGQGQSLFGAVAVGVRKTISDQSRSDD